MGPKVIFLFSFFLIPPLSFSFLLLKLYPFFRAAEEEYASVLSQRWFVPSPSSLPLPPSLTLSPLFSQLLPTAQAWKGYQKQVLFDLNEEGLEEGRVNPLCTPIPSSVDFVQLLGFSWNCDLLLKFVKKGKEGGGKRVRTNCLNIEMSQRGQHCIIWLLVMMLKLLCV